MFYRYISRSPIVNLYTHKHTHHKAITSSYELSVDVYISTWFSANDAMLYAPILQVQTSGFYYKVRRSMCRYLSMQEGNR